MTISEIEYYCEPCEDTTMVCCVVRLKNGSEHYGECVVDTNEASSIPFGHEYIKHSIQIARSEAFKTLSAQIFSEYIKTIKNEKI